MGRTRSLARYVKRGKKENGKKRREKRKINTPICNSKCRSLSNRIRNPVLLNHRRLGTISRQRRDNFSRVNYPVFFIIIVVIVIVIHINIVISIMVIIDVVIVVDVGVAVVVLVFVGVVILVLVLVGVAVTVGIEVSVGGPAGGFTATATAGLRVAFETGDECGKGEKEEREAEEGWLMHFGVRCREVR